MKTKVAFLYVLRLTCSSLLVRAPDSINGDGYAAAAAAASGAAILDSDNSEMTKGTFVCYSLKFRK